LEDAQKQKVIIKVKTSQESQNRILKTYNIQYDRSEELRETKK